MNIVMITNTYKPIVGGLERSIEVFSEEYRKRGHQVLIVTPQSKNTPEKEEDIFRVRAVQNFNGTDFSVELPISAELKKILDDFKPNIIHSHHPFLIGDTALRVSAAFNIPMIFTHHTLYEKNTHYVPGDSKALKRFVVQLAVGYANLCDQVIAPSQSVADLLIQRRVTTPITVIPTGIDVKCYQGGDGRIFRKFFNIPQQAFLVGIVSRIAPEKNNLFLSQAVALFLKHHPQSYAVVVGEGPSLPDIQAVIQKEALGERVIWTGLLKGKQLIHAYAALDVLAFASHSETQGLVLVEAMAAGTPIVAVDAPGVRDVVEDRKNGRLIRRDDRKKFSDALAWIAKRSPNQRKLIAQCAKMTAGKFSETICAKRMLQVYTDIQQRKRASRDLENNRWKKSMRILKAETSLMANITKATGSALKDIGQTAVRKTAQKIKQKITGG